MMCSSRRYTCVKCGLSLFLVQSDWTTPQVVFIKLHVCIIVIRLPRCVLKPMDGKHFYDTDFGLFPSVTTILGATSTDERKNMLIQWQERVGYDVAEHIKNRAAGIGTAAHLLNNAYQARKHGLPIPTEPLNEQYNLFGTAHHLNCRPFLDTVSNVYALEQAVFSSSLKLAGTIDCIGTVDGQTCVIDYKTKGRPQAEMWMEDPFQQGSLYAQMWNEHVEEKYRATRIIIVASSEHGTLQLFDADPLQHMDAALERVVTYYEMQN